MKTTHLVAALTIFAVSGSVLANGAYTDPAAGFVSTKTRAQVRAEVEHAHAQGLLNQNTEITRFDEPSASVRGVARAQQKAPSKTRAQVRRELEEARAQGLLDRNSETARLYEGA